MILTVEIKGRLLDARSSGHSNVSNRKRDPVKPKTKAKAELERQLKMANSNPSNAQPITRTSQQEKELEGMRKRELTASIAVEDFLNSP